MDGDGGRKQEPGSCLKGTEVGSWGGGCCSKLRHGSGGGSWSLPDGTKGLGEGVGVDGAGLRSRVRLGTRS